MKQCLSLLLVIAASGRALWGQLGELQAGVIGSYGTRDPYRGGAGLVFGVAPGRLVYTGLRWIYYGGATISSGPAATPTNVRNRAQEFATDLGVEIPVTGGVDALPMVSLGVVQFAQRGYPTTGPVAGHSKEFFAAPGLAMEVSVGRIAVIPEVQYYFTGDTELTWPVHNRGLAVSVRLVFLAEVRRIRR